MVLDWGLIDTWSLLLLGWNKKCISETIEIVRQIYLQYQILFFLGIVWSIDDWSGPLKLGPFSLLMFSILKIFQAFFLSNSLLFFLRGGLSEKYLAYFNPSLGIKINPNSDFFCSLKFQYFFVYFYIGYSSL